MNESVTVSFIATAGLKQALEVWARESDRSVSAELRQILMREVQRRQLQQQANDKSNQVNLKGTGNV